MRNKAKGDLLELMVYILQKSFSDNPSTLIKTKHKIPDRDNVLREIDIYVEVTVNNQLLKYAFECKDHKVIKLEHITDFQSKIDGKGIKGNFVTTNHYQKGAISKAEALNIDLHKLKRKQVKDESIKDLLLLNKSAEIVEFDFQGKILEQTGHTFEEVFKNCINCRENIMKVLNDQAIPFLMPHLDEGIDKMYPTFNRLDNVANTLGKQNSIEVNFMCCFYDTSISHGGTKFSIDFVVIKLFVWNESFRINNDIINSYQYFNHDESKIFATLSLADFYIKNENIIAGITRINNGERKIVSGKKSEIEDLDVAKFSFQSKLTKEDIEKIMQNTQDIDGCKRQSI